MAHRKRGREPEELTLPTAKQTRMEDFLLTQVPLSNRFSVLSTDAAIPPDEELTEEAVTTAPAKGTNGANEAFGEKNDTHKKGEGQPVDLLESSSLCKLIAETLEHIYGELRLLNSKMNKLSSGSPSYSPSRVPCIWPESKEPSCKLSLLSNKICLMIHRLQGFRPTWTTFQDSVCHLRSLVRGGLRIDMSSVETLNNSRYNQRVILTFKTSTIPVYLLRNKEFLASKGIYPTRVFQDLGRKPLLPSPLPSNKSLFSTPPNCFDPRDKQMQTAKPSKLDDLGNLLPLIASQVNDFRELHSSHIKLDKERKTNRLDSTKQNQIPSRLSISPTVICNINPSGEAEQKDHPAHLPVEGALDQSTLTLPTNQVNLNSPQFDLDEGLNARSLLSPDRSLLPPVTDLGQGKEHKENSVDIDVELHPIRVTNWFQLESGKSWAQELLELKQTEPPRETLPTGSATKKALSTPQGGRGVGSKEHKGRMYQNPGKQVPGKGNGSVLYDTTNSLNLLVEID